MLTLGEFASVRVASGLALFCKPHFKQSFLEAGRYDTIASEANSAPLSPSAKYRPSGVTLFEEHEVAVPQEPAQQRRKEGRPKEAFESGHPAEFRIGQVTGLASSKCTACAGKVFMFSKLETKEGLCYHKDW